MITQALKLLAKKQLLIVGKTDSDRAKSVTELLKEVPYQTFRFPSSMKTIDEYLDFVKKHKLYDPWYTKKGSYNFNQIMDFHRDWITENHVLIVMEEFDKMEERWRIDLLRSYLEEVENREKGKKNIHLIISQASADGILTEVSKVIQSDKKGSRTNKQVVEGSIKILELF